MLSDICINQQITLLNLIRISDEKSTFDVKSIVYLAIQKEEPYFRYKFTACVRYLLQDNNIWNPLDEWSLIFQT